MNINRGDEKRKPPAHDRIGNVVIVRENAVEGWSIDELVEVFNRVYKGLRAIYVKTGTVGRYRIPVLKLLWGEEVEYTIHREYGLRFKVYLGRVYYNPRLGEEHHRLALETRDGERIADVFSGIGGFTIHIAANRRTYIHANDLNPYSYRSIIENIMLNHKRIKSTITVSNLDTAILPEYFENEIFDRVISNLPMEGDKFFEVYDNLLRRHGILHLYLVGKGCSELYSRIPSGWNILQCKPVLDYAPYTYIYRIDLVKR